MVYRRLAAGSSSIQSHMIVPSSHHSHQFHQQDSPGTCQSKVSAMLKAAQRLGLGVVIITVLSLLYFILMTQSAVKLIHPREELHNCCSTQDDFILTQKNTKIGMTIRYAITKGKTFKVNSALTRLLPKTSPLSGRRFSRCSVVGNGAILSQSGCGQEIDKADYVFRCNLPPIGGKYAEDTGLRTNFTTANPISQISWVYKGLRNQQGRDKFMTDIKKYPGLLWVSAFGVKSATAISQQALKFVTQKRIRSPALVFGNPKHFTDTMNFWKAHNLSNRLSTGMYLSSIALSVCDQVHIFGFWPFDKDPEDQPLAYHYYGKGKVDQVHDMPQEFLKLLEWHQEGVVNVHVHKCQADS
ncbi:alpha-2,8-sialyltransferase 8F-like isoform X6 [Branchiostoma floridae x Branchiostoma belcheri]